MIFTKIWYFSKIILFYIYILYNNIKNINKYNQINDEIKKKYKIANFILYNVIIKSELEDIIIIVTPNSESKLSPYKT